jgi:hypothetical protein
MIRRCPSWLPRRCLNRCPCHRWSRANRTCRDGWESFGRFRQDMRRRCRGCCLRRARQGRQPGSCSQGRHAGRLTPAKAPGIPAQPLKNWPAPQTVPWVLQKLHDVRWLEAVWNFPAEQA